MELITHCIRKHPMLSTFYLWLWLFFTFARFTTDEVFVINYVFSALLIILPFSLNELFLKKTKENYNEHRKKRIAFTAVSVLYCELTLFLYSIIPGDKFGFCRNASVILFSGLIVIAAAIIYFRIKKIYSVKKLIVLIFLVSLFFHLYFNLYSEFDVQMDLKYLCTEELPDGHMGYIRYLYNNFLPYQGDPRPYWQFYHPPLHHYLEALLLRAETLAGAELEIAVSNIKFLPLLYYMLMSVIMVKLCSLINLKGMGKLITLAVCFFTPAFIFLANYANNDMLCVLFMTASFYLSLVWYKNRTFANIVKIALCFGAGMMTKLSAWMVAVPIAVIFISALIEKLKEKEFKAFGKLMGEMGVFLVITAPLSLYWSLRNYFRFGVPIAYIPVSQPDYMKVDKEPLQRLFDFSPHQFRHAYVEDLSSGDYVEYNPLIALIKSSSANLYINKCFGSPFDTLNLIAFYITIIVSLAAFACMVYLILKKNSLPFVLRLAAVGLYLTVFICYYVFCIKYPSSCTENSRYATQLIVIGAFSLGMVYNKIRKRKKLRKSVLILTAAYCLFSVLPFIADGLWITLYFKML